MIFIQNVLKHLLPTTKIIPWEGAYSCQSERYILIVSRTCGSAVIGDAEAYVRPSISP